MIGEVGGNRREENINRYRKGCAVIWSLRLVIKGGGVSTSMYSGY